MSRENVERCHQVYDAFNRRDFETWLEIHGEDVEVTPLAAAVGSPYRGATACAGTGAIC
jgi:hypothetical protein